MMKKLKVRNKIPTNNQPFFLIFLPPFLIGISPVKRDLLNALFFTFIRDFCQDNCKGVSENGECVTVTKCRVH